MPYRRRPKAFVADLSAFLIVVAALSFVFINYNIVDWLYEESHSDGGQHVMRAFGVFLALLLASTGMAIRYLFYMKSLIDQYDKAKEKIAELVDINVKREKMVALNEITGGLAHEINNSLQPTIGLGQFIKDGLKDSGNKKHQMYMETIINSAKHAQQIIENVLTFSHEKNLTMGQGPASAALYDAVRFSMNMMKPTIIFELKGFPDLDKLENDSVQIDYNQTGLYEIIINIMKNAANSMDYKGTISVAYEHGIMPHPPHVSAICLSIADTGRGMDENTLKKIYDPFFTTKDISEGTGLGLAIVHGLMRQHSGQIVVRSKPGEGTVFVLYFPIKPLAQGRSRVWS